MVKILTIFILATFLACGNKQSTVIQNGTEQSEQRGNQEDSTGFKITYQEDYSSIHPKDQSKRESWFNKMRKDPVGFFKKILGIYKGGFLSKEHEEFITSVLKDPTKKAATETTLFVSEDIEDKDLAASHLNKIPIYIGATDLAGSSYSNKKLKKVLGYSTQEPGFGDRVSASTRYVVGGTSYIDTNRQPNNPSSVKWIHVWGPNFEGSSSYDYKTLVKNKKLDRVGYAKTLGKSLYNVFVAAKSFNPNGKVYLRLPGIGQGVYLSLLSTQDTAFANAVFVEIVAKLSQLPEFSNIQVDLCLWDGILNVFKSNKCPTATKLYQQGGTNFNPIDKGDLFDLSSYSKQDLVALVNAWDNRSFVGNGRINDGSIDGYAIAAMGPGKKLPNTAYTHNAPLSTTPKQKIAKYRPSVDDNFYAALVESVG